MINSIVLPYKTASQSAKALAKAMGVKCVNLNGSIMHRARPKFIINWGNTGNNLPPEGLGSSHVFLNPMSKVRVACNKLMALQALSEASVRVPDFTTDPDVANDWLDAGHTVVERASLTSHSGNGITITEPDSYASVNFAPLYTKYIKKQQEYRVHVLDGVVIDVQRKARRHDVDNPNWQVRNFANGFTYARQDVNPPKDVLTQGVKAVDALGLDFGAVDVIYNSHQGKAYVLEVNTAAGLTGTTLERYAAELTNAIMSLPITPYNAQENLFELQADRYSRGISLEDVELYEEEIVQPPTEGGDKKYLILVNNSNYINRTYSSLEEIPTDYLDWLNSNNNVVQILEVSNVTNYC